MATKRNNASLAPDLEFISKDTGLDLEPIIEKAIRDFIARYTLVSCQPCNVVRNL